VHGSAPAGRRVAVTAAPVFDAFFDQVGLLARGDCLVVAPEQVRRDPQRLCRWVVEAGIEVLNLTPSVIGAALGFGFAQVLDEHVAMLIVGGEAVPARLWQLLRGLRTRCVNLYGPTECTVDSTYAWLDDHPFPTIGKALPGTRAHVLNDDLAPVPPGGIGTLHVAGPRLALGYLGEAKETAACGLFRARSVLRHAGRAHVQHR
jgi:non-ribosomal peptide synthetase component F